RPVPIDLGPRGTARDRRDPRLRQPHPDRVTERGPDARSTDPPPGGGPPAWLAATLNHCTNCGGPLILGPIPGEERHRLACASCGHIAYVNPRLVTTTIRVTQTGEVVLIRRGFEPGRGLWAQPGGFLEVD